MSRVVRVVISSVRDCDSIEVLFSSQDHSLSTEQSRLQEEGGLGGTAVQRATLGSRLLRNSKDAGHLFYLSNHFFSLP